MQDEEIMTLDEHCYEIEQQEEEMKWIYFNDKNGDRSYDLRYQTWLDMGSPRRVMVTVTPTLLDD